MLGIAVALLAGAYVLFRMRGILPVGIIKLGVSLFQIIASGSTSYRIPWYVRVVRLVLCRGHLARVTPISLRNALPSQA